MAQLCDATDFGQQIPEKDIFVRYDDSGSLHNHLLGQGFGSASPVGLAPPLFYVPNFAVVHLVLPRYSSRAPALWELEEARGLRRQQHDTEWRCHA